MTSQIKILLIEDDEVDGMFFQRSLKATGIDATLFIATDAAKGVDAFRNESFDCVFLDYMLPGIDGLQVLTQLMEIRDCSILLVTSHGNEKIAVDAMKAGALDYISKNLITTESLAQIIRNVIRLRDAQKERRAVEEALKQSENRHRVFFEKNLAFLCTHDLEGNFLTVNPAGANSLNYSQEELIGTSLRRIISPSTQHLFDIYLKTIREEKSLTGEMRIVTRLGEERMWMYSNYLHEDGNESYVIGSVQDISDRYKIEQERLKSKRLAEESEEIWRMANEINIFSNKIKDSINYAKRLQDGIYISRNVFDRVFRNSFIVNYPKEIVSGDFYWFNIKNRKRIIALADCTGHGVPGALLSTLGYTMLHNILLNNNFTSPDQMLRKLCVDWRKTFENHNKQARSHDGMEIALCFIDYEKKIIEFSGLGGSLYLVRSGELMEYKSEHIGISNKYQKPFISDMKNILCHNIPFEKGDCIYLSSDGYYDQFGGPVKSKFTKKRFKDLIIELDKFPIGDRGEIVENTFKDWKGIRSQIDDVLVIGIQL